jgi:Phosphohistidine phosphatase SixA
MLRLMLFRHAHADRPDGVEDHERPLSERGRAQAHRMGAFLGEHGLVPDVVIVSTSRRTQETWAYAVDAAGFSAPLVNEPRVYESSAGDLLEVLRGHKESRCLMLVGHNPGIERLAAWLIGDGDPAALARLQREFVVAGLAVLDFDIAQWSELDVQKGRLERFETPDTVGA